MAKTRGPQRNPTMGWLATETETYGTGSYGDAIAYRKTFIFAPSDWLGWLESVGGEYQPDRDATPRARVLLAARLKQLAKRHLTKRQHQVFSLMITGLYTQVEVGRRLGLCQPTIYKALYGNGTKRGIYGGAIPKLRAVADKDWICQYLLTRICDDGKNRD